MSGAMRKMISGIGGTFIFARDAATLAAWYSDVLGILTAANVEEGNFYHEFLIREADGERRLTRCVWAIFQREADATDDPSGVTINYRVDDMTATLAHIRERGVTVERTEDHSYGRFAWLNDPEGRRIELFEDAAIGDESEPG